MNKLNKVFKINPLYESDGYKVGHKAMLAPGTTKLYGTWIPRNLKYMPKGITKIMSAGQQMVVRYLHASFAENFFFNEEKQIIDEFESLHNNSKEKLISLKSRAMKFVSDMSKYLGTEYDGKHFEKLWDLGYLPIKIKALPEGMFTEPNVPHMTFINTVDGYAWLTLYLETMISKLAWQMPTVATIAHKFRSNANEWVAKTDKENMFLTNFMCHDFHSRGGNPFTSIAAGLGHAFTNNGGDTLNVIPASRHYYDEDEDSMPVFSVNASEHSVSTTKIFTVGEQQMIADWLELFPTGILSIVSDTFDLWKLITEYLPANKDAIMARDGKLVIRPDSGDPVDIICGTNPKDYLERKSERGRRFVKGKFIGEAEYKGVIEFLWDIFGGTINEQGYKVLDPHIGAIYGDSINLERQVEIYERLAAKKFAATNIVLGIGSFSYVYMTRDQAGWAAKGAWFEVNELQADRCILKGIRATIPIEEIPDICFKKQSYNIYKDPVTDDGTKRSLKGLISVIKHSDEDIREYCKEKQCDIMGCLGICKELLVKEECTPEEENQGLLQVIYEDGHFHNQTTLTKIREKITF
jgi:nicotinamide phosphoribosyltransferase